MMLPIGIGLVQAMADLLARRSGEPVDPRRLRFGTAMMLMAAYAASTGGIGTPVGTPPNLIGLKFIAEQAGRTISFFEWMLLAVPLLVVLYGFLFVLLHRLNRPELPAIPEGQEYARRELARLGPWSRGERNALGAFLLTVALWIAPAAIALLRGSDSNAFKAYDARMPEAVAAMAGGILLFLLPVDWKRRQFTLDWQRAARIDWGTLLLYGGGISLGRLMFESGLAEAIGSGLLRLTGFDSLWGITFATIVTSILVSEVTSNTATASMIVPVAISLARAAGFDPLPPALGATLGASWGFMLPVATPPNAVVYGTGMIPITKMIRAGIIFDVLGAAVIWTGLRVMVPALGW
jgi:sodium-dependent dicarboxylate transporter 2/3/5